ETAEILRDEKMQMVPLLNHRAQLIIPSFRAEFFTDSEMNRITSDFKYYKELIVDLRGNSGGNFVAGLRILSTLICEPTVVGSLIKPRSEKTSQDFLANDLDDLHQLELLD